MRAVKKCTGHMKVRRGVGWVRSLNPIWSGHDTEIMVSSNFIIPVTWPNYNTVFQRSGGTRDGPLS